MEGSKFGDVKSVIRFNRVVYTENETPSRWDYLSQSGFVPAPNQGLSALPRQRALEPGMQCAQKSLKEKARLLKES